MTKPIYACTVTFYGIDKEDFNACLNEVCEHSLTGWNVKSDFGDVQEVEPATCEFFDPEDFEDDPEEDAPL